MRTFALPGSGVELTEVGLGTLHLSELAELDACALLELSIRLGITGLDTARDYAGGEVERRIGRWLRSHGRPAGLQLITKACHPRGRSRLTHTDLWEDIDGSLEALKVERLDVLLLHRDDEAVPVDEVVDWLDEALGQGLVAAWGVSNWSAARTEAVYAAALARRRTPPALVSNQFGLARPGFPLWPGCRLLDAAGQAFHTRTQVPHLAWSATCRGFFAGRLDAQRRRPPAALAADDGDDAVACRAFWTPDNLERRRRAEDLARRRRMEPTQVALAGLTRQPFPSLALVGARSAAELDQAVAATRLPLDPDESAWLDLRQPRAHSPLRDAARTGVMRAHRVVVDVAQRVAPPRDEPAPAPPPRSPVPRPVGDPSVGSVLGEEEVAAVRALIAEGADLGQGEAVRAFEAAFAARVGAAHAVATSSCTAALDVAAEVLGLGPGDEVVCTPQSYWATASALVQRGVRLRFADVDPRTLNVDPATVAPLLGPGTRAVYVVHYAGHPADLDALRALTEPLGIPIVEDCAHALGARSAGRPIGGGDIACFSFGSTKNLTTLGQGGMLCTRDAAWAARARRLVAWGTLGARRPREHDLGPERRPPCFDNAFESWDEDLLQVDAVGSNRLLSTPAARVGLVQLGRLDGLLHRRRQIAARYTDAFRGLPGLRVPEPASPEDSAWHLYALRLDPEAGLDRDAVIRHLQDERQVEVVLRYFPIHLQAPLRLRGHARGECPVAERIFFREQLNLPISPGMSDADVSAVIAAVRVASRACQRSAASRWTPEGFFSQDYFDELEDGSTRSARVVVPALLEAFGVASVLDVGCGPGYWLREFAAQGVTDIQGVELPYARRRRLVVPESRIAWHDIAAPLDLGRRFDLVLSLEAAQYCAPEAAGTIVDSLARHGDLILFSSAIPGQNPDDLNPRWQDEWIALFEARGYTVGGWFRRAFWEHPEVGEWYSQNAFLAASPSWLAAHPEQRARFRAEAPARIVHPRLFSERVGRP